MGLRKGFKMKKYPTGIIIAFLLVINLVVTCNTGLAADTSQDTVTIKTGLYKSSEGEMFLSRGVTIIKGENKITAPRGTYYEKEEKAILKGGVKLTRKDGDINSKMLTVLLNKDIYIFEDNVELFYQVKEKGADGPKEMELKAPYLELSTADNSFVARNGVTIKYDNRVIKGDRAVYSDEKQTLELYDDVKVQEKGWRLDSEQKSGL